MTVEELRGRLAEMPGHYTVTVAVTLEDIAGGVWATEDEVTYLDFVTGRAPCVRLVCGYEDDE